MALISTIWSECVRKRSNVTPQHHVCQGSKNFKFEKNFKFLLKLIFFFLNLHESCEKIKINFFWLECKAYLTC